MIKLWKEKGKQAKLPRPPRQWVTMGRTCRMGTVLGLLLALSLCCYLLLVLFHQATEYFTINAAYIFPPRAADDGDDVPPEYYSKPTDDSYCARVDIPYRNQMNNDLQPFRRHKITRQTMDLMHQEFVADSRDAILFHIRDNQVYVSFGTDHEEQRFLTQVQDLGKMMRWAGMLAALMLYACHVALPDMDGWLHMEDGIHAPCLDKYENQSFPLFGFQKRPNQDVGILLPFQDHVMVDLRKFGQEVRRNYPWHAKRNVAFWRGSSTGGHYSLDNWKSRPRTQLVQKCQRNETLQCDAGFYHYHGDEQVQQVMMAELGTKQPASLASQMQNKYLISLDGNGACAGRFEKIISGNSLLIKQESPYVEFYYTGLEANTHYVPVQYHMENLEEQIDWIREHDDQAQTIVQAMQTFAKSLQPHVIACYVQELLREYAKLLDYELQPIDALPRVHHILPNTLLAAAFPKTCRRQVYPCDLADVRSAVVLVNVHKDLGSQQVPTCRNQPSWWDQVWHVACQNLPSWAVPSLVFMFVVACWCCCARRWRQSITMAGTILPTKKSTD